MHSDLVIIDTRLKVRHMSFRYHIIVSPTTAERFRCYTRLLVLKLFVHMVVLCFKVMLLLDVVDDKVEN